MKKLIPILFILFSMKVFLSAQSVGINTTGALPNASAMLDVNSANTGILVPRVALTATNSASPITGPANSLFVYNTAVASSGATAVTPGYYYWDAGTNAWIRVLNTGNAWQTGGNYGTSPATNFAGTIDAQDFVFRTSNTERMRITAGGLAGIGTSAPGVTLDIVGSGSNAVDVRVNGRLQTGDAAGNGGIWLSNATDGFMGNNGGNVGFWTNGVGWNAFQIVKTNGRIGIGTTAPGFLFHMYQTSTAANTAMATFENASANGVSLSAIATSTVNPFNGLEGISNYTGNVSVPSAIMGLAITGTLTAYTNGVRGWVNGRDGYGVWGARVTAVGTFGQGGMFQGGLGYTGGLNNFSDMRLKKDIQPLTHALSIIQSLYPKTYYFDTEKYPYYGFDNSLQYGFLSQDLEQIVPSIVREARLNEVHAIDPNQPEKVAFDIYKAYDFPQLIPIITAAVKELDDQLIELKKENKDLKDRLEKLEKQVNQK